jgi:hypothetical protein
LRTWAVAFPVDGGAVERRVKTTENLAFGKRASGPFPPVVTRKI